MEVARRFIIASPTGSGAYLTLQFALIQRYVARGGTAEDFCQRLAPAFRRRWGPVLLHPDAEAAGLPVTSRQAA